MLVLIKHSDLDIALVCFIVYLIRSGDIGCGEILYSKTVVFAGLLFYKDFKARFVDYPDQAN